MRLYYLIDSLGLVFSAIGIMSFLPCFVALIYGDMFSLILFAILGFITFLIGQLMHRLIPSERLLNLKKQKPWLSYCYLGFLFG